MADSSTQCEDDLEPNTVSASRSASDFISLEVELSGLNESLLTLGESPVVKQKVNTRPLYLAKKYKSIQGAVERKRTCCRTIGG